MGDYTKLTDVDMWYYMSRYVYIVLNMRYITKPIKDNELQINIEIAFSKNKMMGASSDFQSCQ